MTFKVKIKLKISTS